METAKAEAHVFILEDWFFLILIILDKISGNNKNGLFVFLLISFAKKKPFPVITKGQDIVSLFLLVTLFKF